MEDISYMIARQQGMYVEIIVSFCLLAILNAYTSISSKFCI